MAYTDGANETFNPQRRRFSTERLEHSIQTATGRSRETLLDELLARLNALADGEERLDDTTLLAFRRRLLADGSATRVDATNRPPPT